MKKIVLIVFALFSFITWAGDALEMPGFRILDAAHKSRPEENILLSPLSMQQCFSMLVDGAGENTAGELLKYLGLDKDNSIFIRQTVNGLKSCRDIHFDSCNSAVFDHRLPVEQRFIDEAFRLCDAKIYKADFNRPADCADLLNALVKVQSRGMIDGIFQEMDFSGKPLMVLLNVLYFKGAWATPFAVGSTIEMPFAACGKNSPQMVDMMCAELTVPYCNDGIIHGVTLAYKEKRIKMMFLMPVDPQAPLTLVTEKLAADGLKNFIGNSTMEKVTDIRIPKLRISEDSDLRTLLSNIGIELLFSASRSDLQGVVRGIPLYVDGARQVVKLDLNEAGTEVAAVTSIMTRSCAVRVPAVEKNIFHADRPFVMVLFDSDSGVVLLTAVVNRVDR